MPGSADNGTLLRVFGYTPMPATMKQIGKGCAAGEDLAFRVVYTRIGNGVIQDGDRFWVSDEVLAEAQANVEKEIAEWEKYLSYLKMQRERLAKRGIQAPPVNPP